MAAPTLGVAFVANTGHPGFKFRVTFCGVLRRFTIRRRKAILNLLIAVSGVGLFKP